MTYGQVSEVSSQGEATGSPNFAPKLVSFRGGREVKISEIMQEVKETNSVSNALSTPAQQN